ncbi:hypothetical protein PVK06_019970 [Gossypium arboreum]|uniref:Uncharacterized protein n=1 Tax=Gossypium arboreum TaxID=29729 RepID=A0ABR0PLR5_GOSAR|nr:hypothetical protein PVK06_019970 [Gossypium arboreum]
MCLLCLGAANSILDSSTRWWKDGGPKYTFYLPCGDYTITLENMALQLGLSVDVSVVIGAAIIPSKVDLCAALLGKVPNKFDDGQILMNWSAEKFDKLSVDAIKVATIPSRLQRMQKTKLEISRVGHIILGVVSGHKTGEDVNRWLPATVAVVGLVDYNFYVPELNHGPSYVGIPQELEDIRLLLDKRLEVEDVICRHRYYILHPLESVGQLEDVGYEGTVDSVRDGGNVGIRPGGATVKLEATNSTSTARLERTAQGGHA